MRFSADPDLSAHGSAAGAGERPEQAGTPPHSAEPKPEQRKTQESLLLAQLSMEQAPDPIHWIEADGRVAYANRSMCDLLGYSPEEIAELHIWDFSPDMMPEVHRETWERVVRGEFSTRETYLVCKDGTSVEVEISATSVELEDRRVVVAFFRDITGRKQAERSLKDSEERYRHLFELEADAILLWKEDTGEILDANAAAVSLYGYSREELLGMAIAGLFADQQAAETHPADPQLEWHRKRDGTIFPVETRDRQFEWRQDPVRVLAVRDVTERRENEESLWLTQYAVDNAPDLIHFVDGEGRLLYVNNATCSALGYTKEELQQLRIWDISPSSSPDSVGRRWIETAGGHGLLAEETMRAKDGREFTVELSTSRFQHGGKDVGIAFVRDVSDRQRAEQSLRDSEERYRQLFELESDAIVLAEDASRKILQVNEAAVELYGYSRAELLGMKDTDLFAPPAEYEAAHGGGLEIDLALNWHRKKDGTLFQVETRGRHFHWKDRAVHVAAIRDATERRKAEQALEESRRMLRLVLDTVPMFVAWRDTDLKFLGCNTAAAADADLPGPEAIVGLRPDDLPILGIPPAANADDREVMSTGVPKLQYQETVHPVGRSPRVMRTSKVPLRDSSGRIFGVLGVHEDVTEHDTVLAALRERDEQLRQSQKMEAIGRLAGGIAHDFNNVLTTIIGYSDLILATPDADAEATAQDVAEIRAAAERATSLTRSILAFSRRQPMQPQVLSLNTVIAETERLLARTIGADVELRVLCAEDLGLVEIDEHQFVQVLLNLAVNARDAMPTGGMLTLETSNVELTEAFCRTHPDAHPGYYVMLAVTDNGSGMDAETQAHVFEPFYTTKAPGQGTGLGLSTVYGVVAQSGGCTYLQSELGRGTTFEIYLPRYDRPSGKAETPADADSAPWRPVILLLDDDPTFRAVSTRMLEKRGFDVLPAGEAEEAVAMLADPNIEVDLLLTDVVLPGPVQGIDVALKCSSMRPGLPILYMSAYARDTIEKAGYLEEGVDFLEKPFLADHLVARIREMLDDRTGPR